MFCRKCGTQIPDDAIFCPACGTETHDSAENSAQTNNYTPEQNTYNSEAESEALASDMLASEALKYGIMGVAFAQTGILSILGIIFSSIAQNKAAEYHRRTGRYGAKAGVGRGLGIGGLALGIFMTVFFALYFIIIAAALGMSF